MVPLKSNSTFPLSRDIPPAVWVISLCGASHAVSPPGNCAIPIFFPLAYPVASTFTASSPIRKGSFFPIAGFTWFAGAVWIVRQRFPCSSPDADSPSRTVQYAQEKTPVPVSSCLVEFLPRAQDGLASIRHPPFPYRPFRVCRRPQDILLFPCTPKEPTDGNGYAVVPSEVRHCGCIPSVMFSYKVFRCMAIPLHITIYYFLIICITLKTDVTVRLDVNQKQSFPIQNIDYGRLYGLFACSFPSPFLKCGPSFPSFESAASKNQRYAVCFP